MRRLQITLLLLIVCSCSISFGFSFTCKEAERKALLNFTHNFIDRCNLLTSWVGEDCCSWKGVGCDNVTGNVIMLDLSPESFSSQYYCLEASREVNPALLELKYLTYLDLSFVDIYMSGIPKFFGSMRQLQYLNLSFASFSGELLPHLVLPHLGNLTNLVVLDLKWAGGDVKMFKIEWEYRFNFGFGTIEGNNLEWAFKLENLKYLDLSGFDLSQSLDSLNILHKLPSLSVLNLADCGLGNSHIVTLNSTISSSTIHHLDLHLNNFSGPFPHFIQNMSSIRFLDLSYNYFNSPIPSWLGNKGNLRYLSLGYNYFNGPFPRSIKNSSFLTSLDLSYNQFSSSIPSWLSSKRYLDYLSLSNNHFNHVDGGIMNTIGCLCRLKHLDLSHNQLQEEVSESYVNFSMCRRYDLEYLYMQNNSISGYLPITESTLSLRVLDASYNNIETLPTSLGGLSYLQTLDLSHNNLETLPTSLGGLSSLQTLDLSHNNLETLPPSLGRLSSLNSLDLSYNNLSVVHHISLSNLSSLRHLDISSNSAILDLSPDWMPPFQLDFLSIILCKLNSPFPNWVLSQKKMLLLDLSDTGIFGPLPDNIDISMPSLQSIQLANNHINGSIPTSLCGLAGLNKLHLQNNRFFGILPDCWSNSQFGEVDLSSNKLSGPIPKSLIRAAMYSLRLNNNSFEGVLPLSLSTSPELELLDLSMNKLHGEIPPWNGANFPLLQILILRENRFEGVIPPQLCTIQTLHIINLANNNLVGTVPQCFGYFKRMGSRLHSIVSIASAPNPNIAPNSTSALSSAPACSGYAQGPTSDFNALEVVKGQEREYTKILDQLVNMDLSCNHLVGVIPAELTSLSLLVNLNLSHNHLKGTIPKDLGEMKSLESLDLSSNNLSGSIPESISSLDYLSKMDLSFNNLQGKIPTGRHFDTLEDPSIYMGNPGLCGDPTPKKCIGDGIANPPTSMLLKDEEDNKHEKMWLYMVIMLGFATGFWGVIGTLIVHKRWRFAYFQIAEELVDWIYVKVAVRINARANRGR